MATEINKVKVPTCWLNGQNDWMDRDGPNFLLENGYLQRGSMVEEIKDSSHHFYLDNPIDTAANIIKFCLSPEQEKEFLDEISE
jgi:pimeloyl-ACP methyl ester carboxylesterase